MTRRLRARGLYSVTDAERRASRNAVTIFFGALLGTQMSALDAMPLGGFAMMIVLLATAVIILEGVGSARSRRYAFSTLAGYAAALAFIHWRREAFFENVQPDKADRLLLTMAIWLGAVVLLEVSPTLTQAAANDAEDRP